MGSRLFRASPLAVAYNCTWVGTWVSVGDSHCCDEDIGVYASREGFSEGEEGGKPSTTFALALVPGSQVVPVALPQNSPTNSSPSCQVGQSV